MASRVVILEPDLDGHHAFWLALLIEAYRRAGWAVEVLTAADAGRLHAQSALRGYALEESAGVRLHVARAEDDAGLLAEARALARETGAERIFVAFLDRYWSAILRETAEVADGSGAAKLSGIWFHPHALDARWRWAPPLGRRWAMRGRVHRFFRTLGLRRFAQIFFTVEEAVGLLGGRIPAEVLSDPYERVPSCTREEARERLRLPADRTIFLHLGSPERRKGLPDVLSAFERLAESAEAKKAAASGRGPLLLRVGSNARLKKRERRRLDALQNRGLALVVEAFVPAEEVMEYFAAADWILIPYRKFRYSSGILANAIGASRPVIVADYGYAGDFVGRNGCGLVYAHGSKTGLCFRLAEALNERARMFDSAFLAKERERRSPAGWVAHVSRAVADAR